MADNEAGIPARPFNAFNFSVVITVPGMPGQLCSAAFAECDGLEMTMEPKKIQEGGNNVTQIHLVGPVSYGQLSLKRGMTSSFDLWTWFDKVVAFDGNAIRASCVVTMLGRGLTDNQPNVNATFTLTNCLPVKLKAPALNAKDGLIAIEEMQIAYERLTIGG